MGLLFSAWTLVLRRSLANWLLLSAILAGVMLAVALLSSTAFYANALEDLGLRHALRSAAPEALHVQVKTFEYPLGAFEYANLRSAVEQQAQEHLGWLATGSERFARSQPFFAGWAQGPNGPVIPTDDKRPRAQFQFLAHLAEHTVIRDGRLPEAFPPGLSQAEVEARALVPVEALGPGREPVEPEIVFEAAIGRTTAELFQVGVGDRLVLLATRYLPVRAALVEITGIIDPVDPREEYWLGYSDRFGYVGQPPMDFPVAVLLVPEQTFFQGVAQVFPRSQADYAFYFFLDRGLLASGNVGQARDSLRAFQTQLATKVQRVTVGSELEQVVADFMRKLLFTRVPLFLLILQIVGIVLYYLIMVSAMVVERQAAEIALLKSRGASTAQVLTTYVMEGGLICGLGVVVGPLLAAGTVAFLGRTPPFHPLTDGQPLPVRYSTAVFLLAGIAGILAFIALLWPAVQAARLTMVNYRQMESRPGRAPLWQRYYLDLALAVAAGALYYEVRQRGSLLTTTVFGEVTSDPVLLLTPVLAVLAGALLFLRLFPVVLGLVERLLRPFSSAWLSLALVQMVRNPVHYARLVLLLCLASALAVFAAAFGGTLTRSYRDRALYVAGADVRAVGIYPPDLSTQRLTERYGSLTGIETVSVAYRGSSVLPSRDRPRYTLLAVDPETFASAAYFRRDFADSDLPELMAKLRTEQPEEPGKWLPPGSREVGLWVRPRSPCSECTLRLAIRDSTGQLYDYVLGSLGFAEWRVMRADLSDAGDRPPPRFPALVLAIQASWQGNTDGQSLVSFSTDDLIVFTDKEPQGLALESFDDVRDWEPLGSDAGTATEVGEDWVDPHGGRAAAKVSFQRKANIGMGGIRVASSGQPVPMLASRAFLQLVNRKEGDVISLPLPGRSVTAIIQGQLEYFPTLNPEQEYFLVADLDSLLYELNRSHTQATTFPNELWLTVTEEPAQRQALVQQMVDPALGLKDVLDSQQLVLQAESDPLVAAGWGGILWIAFAAVAVLTALGFLVFSYLSARAREVQFAVLRTVGLSWRQIAGLVTFEQVFVIVLGLASGTWIGTRLAGALLPFLSLNERGVPVVPPFIITVDWGTVLWAYVALGVVFGLTIGALITLFSRLPIHHVLRLGDN